MVSGGRDGLEEGEWVGCKGGASSGWLERRVRAADGVLPVGVGVRTVFGRDSVRGFARGALGGFRDRRWGQGQSAK